MKKSTYALCVVLCGLSLLEAGSQNLEAQVVTYTDQASFLSAVNPGFYLETYNSFDDGVGTAPSPQNFSGNGFAYTWSDPPDTTFVFSVQATDGYVAGGPFTAGVNLVVTFTSGNVTAVGGTTFLTNNVFAPLAGGLMVTLNSGETIHVMSTNSYNTEPFSGFTSSVPISSLTLSASDANQFVTLDNLYVGTSTVPEPSTFALAACGGAALLGFGRRRR